MSSIYTRVIPAPGQVPDAIRDAKEVFNVLKAGAVVILPTDVGYGIMSCSAEGIERAFAAKKRKPGHTLGIIGNYRQHRELHDLPEEKFTMSRVVSEDMGSLIAIVAPFHRDHPRLQRLSAQTLQRTTTGDTLGIALPEQPLLLELGRLNDEDGQLMVGSSANLSGKGQKFRVEDIEDEVKDAANLIVDYGLQRYYRYERAGTMVDLENMKVLRIGAAYELFRYRMEKWFGISFPKDPDHSTEGVKVAVSIKSD